MPTILTHAIVPLAAGIARRSAAVAATAGRGRDDRFDAPRCRRPRVRARHSLCRRVRPSRRQPLVVFAAVVASLGALLHRRLHAGAWRIGFWLFACAASHPLLDAFTDGRPGCRAALALVGRAPVRAVATDRGVSDRRRFLRAARPGGPAVGSALDMAADGRAGSAGLHGAPHGGRAILAAMNVLPSTCKPNWPHCSAMAGSPIPASASPTPTTTRAGNRCPTRSRCRPRASRSSRWCARAARTRAGGRARSRHQHHRRRGAGRRRRGGVVRAHEPHPRYPSGRPLRGGRTRRAQRRPAGGAEAARPVLAAGPDQRRLQHGRRQPRLQCRRSARGEVRRQPRQRAGADRGDRRRRTDPLRHAPPPRARPATTCNACWSAAKARSH